MTKFEDHQTSEIIKALLVGNSGAGKTGILASLANEGYTLLIHDFDNGLDILQEYLTEEGRGRTHFKRYDITDPGQQQKFASNVKNWNEDGIPATSELDKNHIIVVDTLGTYAELVRTHVLKLNGAQPNQVAFSKEYWGVMQRVMQQAIMYLTGPNVPCNVIVNTHIKEGEDGKGVLRFYPTTIGNALSRDIGKWFNNIWRVTNKGDDNIVIQTRGDRLIDLKTSRPGALKAEEPANLANIFNKILNGDQDK